MVNLLPPIEKEFLKAEETKRLITILGTVFLAFLACFILILFFVKIYISSQLELQEIKISAAEKEFKQSESQIFQEKINSANTLFSQLNSFYQKELNISDAIEEISGTLSKGIYLNNLSFNPSTEEKNPAIRITLLGFAKDREILFEFKKNLESKVNFQEVYFPPTNWIKPTDIDFNVNFNWSPSFK